MKTHMSKLGILWIILLVIGVSTVAVAGQPSITELRNAQNVEYQELRQRYDAKAQQTVPKIDGKLDTNSPEYEALVQEYRSKRTEISNKYKSLDTRGSDVDAILKDPKYKGRIENVGSSPANMNADVDLNATSSEAAKDLANDWASKKGSKKPQYYTLDNPSVPTTTPPDDFDKVIKVVNPNTDTTLWTPQTEAKRRAKTLDHDAWTTTGGLKATGNTAESRDARGHYLDNEKKFLHSDRPISDTPGIHDEDLKTFSKSVSKAAGEKGANITKNNPEFYEQASKLQKYGDPVEAGIVDLGDSPEVRKQKLEKWKQTARNEMQKANRESVKRGELSDKSRAELAQQMRDQGEHDVADRIEEHRRKVADSNAEAAAQNKKLRAERDDVFGIKDTDTKVGEPKERKIRSVINESPPEEIRAAEEDFKKFERNPKEAQNVTDKPLADTLDPDKKSTPGPTRQKQPDEDLANLVKNSKKKSDAAGMATGVDVDGSKKKSGDADAGTAASGDADASKGAKSGNKNVDVDADDISLNKRKADGALDADDVLSGGKKSAGAVSDVGDLPPGSKKNVKKLSVDGDVGSSKRPSDVDSPIDATAVIETTAQVFQSGTKAAGNAIDENRDLNTDDAVEVIKDITPGIRENEMSNEYIRQRHYDAIDRQNKIRDLENKDKLTLDEEIELDRLRSQEEQNPDTTPAHAAGAIVDAEQHYLDRKNKRKKEDGRENEPDNFIDDGLPMAADMVKDAVNVVNPFTQISVPIAEGVYETQTWEERQAWASQKDTMIKYLNSEANKVDIRSRKNTRLLNEIIENEDLTDPEVQKRLDELVLSIKNDSDRLDKLNAAASSHLKESDPEQLKLIRGLRAGFPDAASLDDWRKQKTAEAVAEKYCAEGTIKISADDEPKKCLTCTELEGEFYSSRKKGYLSYSESLLAKADSCSWVSSARTKIRAENADADCSKKKPGSVAVFRGNSYTCKCTPGETVSVADEGDQAQCISCEEMHGDFKIALGANEREYAELIIELSPGCGWIGDARRDLQQYDRCPENTVKLSDDNNQIHCVSCEELHGDFSSAIDREDRAYAEMLLEASAHCGWASSGRDRLHRTRNCPENTVKLSDQNDEIECVSCEILYGEFNGAVDRGDLEYAQSLIGFAPNCSWTKTAQQRISQAQKCPDNTVKLSDDSDQIQCVPCEEIYAEFNNSFSSNDRDSAQYYADLGSSCGWSSQAWQRLKEPEACPSDTVRVSDQSDRVVCMPCSQLYGEFNAAYSANDRKYAQQLADLGSSCGWSSQAWQRLNTPESCPAGTVKLSDGANNVECVPCESLYGDYVAAANSGDNSYANELIGLAINCGWAHSAAQQQQNERNQAMYDSDCESQVPGSYAVVEGDRYNCYCREGLVALNGAGGSACRTCEDIRQYINSALQTNDLNSVRGLMANAQHCGWYNQAAQIVADKERDNQRQQDQQMQDELQGHIDDFIRNNPWIIGGGGGSTPAQHPPPNTQKKTTQKKTTQKKTTKPPTSSSGGCVGGSCCTGHTMICYDSRRDAKSRYPHASVDRNEDGRCDKCGGSYSASGGGIAPGLKYVLRGNGYKCE